MREHLEFLRISSAVVKVAGWIFLVLGILGSTYIFSGRISGKSMLDAVVNLAVAVFFFFFFYLIAKIADLLIKIINEIKKE
ncbi:MAG: hypothetical protein JW788_01730 [Candidatus Omnitrophica bacterium]|nr:hypothetical protein [Candidatus Omnitrophota bacterium]